MSDGQTADSIQPFASLCMLKRNRKGTQEHLNRRIDRQADGTRAQGNEAGSKSEEAGYLNMQTGTRSIDTQVAMLDGKGCIDVLSQHCRVRHVPGEGSSSIANVDMDRCCL